MWQTLIHQFDRLHQLSQLNTGSKLLIGLLIAAIVTELLYLILYYVLRPIFREFERDIAFVTLNVSTSPLTILFAVLGTKIIFENWLTIEIPQLVGHIFTSIIVVTVSYWLVQLFSKVFIYYLKDYTAQSEVMWDDVFLPILSAVVPVLIFLLGGVVLISSFGIDLTGIWVTLGGATFVLGFALQDILANFFSGIVLLIDTPFRFGDILRLEDGSMGMLRKIGIRVTQVYIFSSHCDVYIPNSVLQGQIITNLSRPTTLYYHSIAIEIPAEGSLDEIKRMIEEIVLAHSDTLGDIDIKLEVMDKYYLSEDSDANLIEQQELGKSRALAEQEVNSQLEDIQQGLEALVVAMQFAEKGGMTEEEIENVQMEYQGVLELMGFQPIEETSSNRTTFNFEENNEEGLLEAIRKWYRIWIKDPNLLDEDQELISDEWERKIAILKRRVQRLSQKIANPQAEETRLDDYVIELIQWLKDKLKVPRKKWQEPQIRMIGMNYSDPSTASVELDITFFVDEIKLEDGKRGERVRSQIYQEVFRNLKNTYLNWEGVKERELEEENGTTSDASTSLTPVNSFVQTGLDPVTAKQGFAFYLSVGRNKPTKK